MNFIFSILIKNQAYLKPPNKSTKLIIFNDLICFTLQVTIILKWGHYRQPV